MKSLLETTRNTRDLGGYPTSGGGSTRCMTLLRSDKPEHPSPADLEFLLSHNITTIIDLREPGAADPERNPFASHPGFFWRHCPIAEGSGIPESVEAVPNSYLAIAESPGAAAAFRCIAEAPGGVLFHCSAGKDRTGVLSAILLLLAGVPEYAVVDDYLLTRDMLRDTLEQLFARFPEIDRSIVTPREGHLLGFLMQWQERYDDAEDYLTAIGLTPDQIRRIRAKLV